MIKPLAIYRCSGIATLELALMTVMLGTLIIGGFAMSSFMQRAYRLGVSLDKNLHADQIRPLKFIASTDGVSLQTDPEALRQLITALADQVEIDAFQTEAHDRYLVEASYALLELDPQTGNIRTQRPGEFIRRGNLVLPSAVAAQTDLGAMFAARARETLPAGNSPYATPFNDPNLALGTGYLPYALLIGARAVLSVEDQLSGRVYAAFGGEPYVLGARVTPVRGEVR